MNRNTSWLKKCFPIGVVTFACLVAIALFSCGDNDPAKPAPFSFNLAVLDTLGNPVPDLEVSVWSFLSLGWPGPVDAVPASIAGPTLVGSTTLWFALARESIVDFDILDLDGNTVEELVDAIRQPAGAHTIVWTPGAGTKNGVYRYRLTATDTLTGNILFEGENHCTMSSQDRGDRIIGYTDASGAFQTHNELLFPGHLNLPTMTATNEQADVVATFEVLASVQITVVDTVNQVGIQRNWVVSGGDNSIELVWKDPAPLRLLDVTPPVVKQSSHGNPPFRPADGQFEWRLAQNFPNPFW